MNSPSTSDWQKLFSLALEFKSTKSWGYLEDRDIFGVQSPKTGEICYCIVFGKEGEANGLAIYIGDEGLMSLLDMLGMRYSLEDQFYHNDFIMIAFTDREYLTKEERDIIKKLGLKFRGSNSWISFRRYLPGYCPRTINKQEGELVISILQEISNTCLRLKEKPQREASDKYLVRMVKEKGRNVVWEDSWVELEYPEEMVAFYEIDKILSESVDISALERTSDEWIIDLFFSPSSIKEEKDEYFPYIGIVWSTKDNEILAFKDFQYVRKYRYTYPQELFLYAVGLTESLPKKVLVKELEAYEALIDSTKSVGVRTELVENLEVTDRIRDFIIEHLPY